jgi:hypothetical protein
MMTGVDKREFASEFSQLYNAPVKQEQESHEIWSEIISQTNQSSH